MKQALFPISILLFFGCIKQPNVIRHYPTDEIHSSSNIFRIDLDSALLNFREVTSLVALKRKEGMIPVIEINDNGITKRIAPYTYTGGLVKSRNIIEVTSDSILKDSSYSLDKLYPILKKHYTNRGQDYRYSDAPEKAIIEITIDTGSTTKALEKSLIQITRIFDEINREVPDTLELRLIFDYFRQLPPPPPPPEDLDP